MRYRENLPQLNGRTLLTDGGLETTLVFLDGFELPEFSAIDMMTSAAKRAHLKRYFVDHLELARRYGVGFVLESTTWRSSHGWREALGYSEEALEAYNRAAVELLHELRREFDTPATPVVVSGCIGPRGDGYVATDTMTAEEARQYHGRQIRLLAEAGVDLVTAMTFNYVEEAIGFALAARDAGVPGVISFTVELDARLITGETLAEAIARVDEATGAAPAYYMINCAHPTHFEQALAGHEPWVGRIRGIRANASKCSHAELDEAETLDIGDPLELAGEYRRLTERLPQITVIGG